MALAAKAVKPKSKGKNPFHYPGSNSTTMAGCKTDYERALLLLKQKGEKVSDKLTYGDAGFFTSSKNSNYVIDSSDSDDDSNICNCGGKICQDTLCGIDNKIECKISPNRGRGLFAKKNFKENEEIFADKGWAFSFGTEWDEYRCGHCCLIFRAQTSMFHMMSTGSVGCNSCKSVKFCSRRCRDKGWEKFHKFECGLTDKALWPHYCRLGYRMFVQTPWDTIKEVVLEDMKRGEYSVQNVPVNLSRSQSYRFIYYLDPGTNHLPEDYLIGFYENAFKLLKFYEAKCKALDPTPKKKQGGTTAAGQPWDERALRLSVIARHIQQCFMHNMSAISLMYDHGDGKEIKSYLIHEANYNVRLYPVGALINHGHGTNIEADFQERNGDTVVVYKALGQIKAGEELVLHYCTGRAFDKKPGGKDLFCKCLCPRCLGEPQAQSTVHPVKFCLSLEEVNNGERLYKL